MLTKFLDPAARGQLSIHRLRVLDKGGVVIPKHLRVPM
jgi:hypothetical protein